MVLIAPVAELTEGLVYDSSNIDLKIGNRVVGRGKLYLSHTYLSWQGDNMETGLNIHWKEISVHGVTNPEKSVFFIMDKKLIWRGVYGDESNNLNGHLNEAMDTEANNSDDEGEEGEEEEEHTELTLISEDPNVAQQIYLAMSELQALHPDTDDSDVAEEEEPAGAMGEDDDDDEDSGFELEHVCRNDDTTDGAQNGMRNLNLGDPRFEDADE